MQTIRAIICFNGGSAGDFLTGACSEQLLALPTYEISNIGRAYLSSTFKTATKADYYNNNISVDLSSVLPIENTHYYLDYYPQLARKLFYIDYPDTMSHDIVNMFLFKRFDNNTELLADFIKKTYAEPIRSKLNANNIIEVCKINWTKNLRSWRNNSQLEPLYLKDYFDRSMFYNMVETVCQCKIKNYKTLSAGYDNWVSKNDQLRQLFL